MTFQIDCSLNQERMHFGYNSLSGVLVWLESRHYLLAYV